MKKTKDVMSSQDFKDLYLNTPSVEQLEKQGKAFQALLAYETNCRNKYDRENKPSLPPKKGETMLDFANKFETTVEEMKQCWREVEQELSRQLQNQTNMQPQLKRT